MILTEHGLHFRKEGNCWRCLEVPGLTMLRDGRYAIGGATFARIEEAVRHTPAGYKPTHAVHAQRMPVTSGRKTTVTG